MILFTKILLNQKEVITLESLRDVILTRLISGELKVPEAEKMIEAVGI